MTQNGCAVIAAPLARRPGRSRASASVNGVTGKPTTPLRRDRRSDGVMVGTGVLGAGTEACASPAGQLPRPGRIDAAAHLGLIVALAVRAARVALAPAGQRIVIEIDAQPGPIGDLDAAVDEADAAAGDDFVVSVLPRVMRVAGERQVRGGG